MSQRQSTGVTDLAWSGLREHLRSLTSAIQDEIRTYPTPIAGCDQQFNYLLEKRDQLIGEANSINDAISRGDLRLASSIVRASGHIDEDVKAGLIANGMS